VLPLNKSKPGVGFSELDVAGKTGAYEEEGGRKLSEVMSSLWVVLCVYSGLEGDLVS
jgi:hypothetical protein